MFYWTNVSISFTQEMSLSLAMLSCFAALEELLSLELRRKGEGEGEGGMSSGKQDRYAGDAPSYLEVVLTKMCVPVHLSASL